MTSNNSGLPDGVAYQGQSSSRANGSNNGSGSRVFSTAAAEAFHAQSAASRTAALAALGVQVQQAAAAAAAGGGVYNATATTAAVVGQAAVHHLSNASASVVHAGSGLSRLDLRQQQQQQQQQQHARYPSIPSTSSVRAAVAVMTAAAAGNDRVTQEQRSHRHSLAVQVQREALVAAAAHQQQHASAVTAALRQHQQQQQQHLQTSRHAATASVAHGYPIHRQPQQQQQQQVSAVAVAAMSHGLAPSAHYGHHHRQPQPQQQAHPHHTTNHIPSTTPSRESEQLSRQAVAARQQQEAQRRVATAQIAAQVPPRRATVPPARIEKEAEKQDRKPPSSSTTTTSLPSKPAQGEPEPEPSDADPDHNDQSGSPQQIPPPPPRSRDHKAILEEKIIQQRSALVDKYAPFIAPSDRSLNHARTRLQKAHEQVQSLRAAFTERVYGKYRVCLRPPPTSAETLEAISANPVAATHRLEQEIERIRLEKEYEKKEAQALNVEFNKMDPSVLSSLHADNADQLMFISAGLSLVILPEDKNVDPKILADYEDRGPVNPTTGQRVKNISQAAAAAGDVILERARKGAAMREQLLRRRTYDYIEPGGSHTDVSRLDVPPDQYSPTDLLDFTMPLGVAVGKATGPAAPSEDSEHDDAGAQVQQSAATTPVTLPQAPKPLAATTTTTAAAAAELQLNTSSSWTAQTQSAGASPAKSMKRLAGKTSSGSLTNLQQLSSAKFGRSRGGAGISVNISLSLNPTADELTLDPDKPFRASTAALLTRCSGTAQGMNRSSPQQRLKHPHPESSGGRQRASSATSAKKELANLALAGAHPQSSPYLHSYLNLALPPLPTTLERRERKSLAVVDRRCSVRAKKAVQSVLRHFPDNGVSSSAPLTKIGLLHGIHKSRAARTSSGRESPAGDRPIDPSLAFSVLQAIGLMTEASGKNDSAPPPEVLDKKVKMVAGGEKRKWVSLANLEDSWNRLGLAKKTRFSDAFKNKREPDRHAEASSNLPSEAATESPAAENIRGGGELLSEANDDTPASGVSESDARKSNNRAGTGNTTYGNHAANVNINNSSSSSSMAHGARPSQPQWENPSRQSVPGMNSHLGNSAMMGANNPHVAVAAAVAQRHHQAQQHHQVQLPAPNNDSYHHATNFNAMQLAHQLRHATNNMAGLAAHSNHTQGELQVSNFLGGLHHSAPWSSISSSAAAMAAAQSSLAALGLSVPMGVYNTVQDRAARALIAREQQNVAAAHAVAAHQQSMSNSSFVGGAANPGFAPTPSSMQHAARTALMNSSAQAYGAAMAQHSQGSILSASMAGQRDSGYRRAVSDAPGNSSQVHAQANATTATSVTRQKRKAASLVAENLKPSPSLTSTSDELKTDAFKKPKASEDNEARFKKASERKDVVVPANAAHMQTTTSALSAPPNATPGQILPSPSSQAAQTQAITSQVAEAPLTKLPPSFDSPGQALQPENAQAKLSLSLAPASHQLFPSQPAAGGLSKPTPDQASRSQLVAGHAKPNDALKGPQVADVPGAALPRSGVEKSTETTPVGTKVDMTFFVQAAPASLSPEQAHLVQTGRVHEAFVAAAFKGGKTGEPSRPAGIIEYLTAVGAAVPIPKAIIAASLKDRLNIPGLKSLASNSGFNIPREIIIAVVLVWLWNNHEEDFQRAFAKSGRIDVDPMCKWLVHASVDASVRALKQYISELGTGRIEKTESGTTLVAESASDAAMPPDVATVLVVSRALTAESCKDDETDYALSQFHNLTRFLDECRLCALHSRSQERVLLASLISLKSTMSESFAHAYVSSMVRAGDALGHDTLADLVGDEELKISSMLPYDVWKDQNGMWEDPCRPAEGYSPKLTGDVLTKGAHARAMIQKSLRRLQDRHNIKGGTPTSGPYTDPISGQNQSPASGTAASNSNNKSLNGSSTPKTWSRRKGATMSSVAEGPCPNGTGSALASSWSVYDPKHFSAPLAWKCDAAESTPYGSTHVKPRGGTLLLPGPNPGAKKKKSLEISARAIAVDPKGVALGRTTHEIDWRTIADKFDNVKLQGGASPRSYAAAPAPAMKTIVSPFCRQLDHLPVASDGESDGEEDLSDDAVLARHQFVLDEMKERLTALMEARKRQQERKKNRQKNI